MDQFSSLSVAIASHFERDFSDLPTSLQERVSKAFQLVPWDKLNAMRRRERALQWDLAHDRGCEPALERMWILQSQIDEEENQLQNDILARWNLPADHFAGLQMQGIGVAAMAKAIGAEAANRGIKSGIARRDSADQWKKKALPVARAIRQANPAITQDDLADAIVHDWPKTYPGEICPVGDDSVRMHIKAMERSGELPRRHTG